MDGDLRQEGLLVGIRSRVEDSMLMMFLLQSNPHILEQSFEITTQVDDLDGLGLDSVPEEMTAHRSSTFPVTNDLSMKLPVGGVGVSSFG